MEQRYFDQLRRSGHDERIGDLDRFAALGIRAIRYPVLWERVAPNGPRDADWSWSDARLERLRALGIRPIVGLLHHGSGPRYTDLLDPAFPEKLAAYARAVAERYPWITEWTPVNEPLTTARFSALYGHWFPHASDDRSFMRALVNQCRGIVLAMAEVRRVNPDAKLVVTEDLGRTYATPRLARQAAFENERRWASLDLLAGRFEARSDFGRWARRNGLSDGTVEWFTDNARPPDVIGINHYPTSQRYLDERVGAYPAWSRGGNGHESYADIEAVRARGDGIASTGELLREAAVRYARPVAVTECHIWSTREQQLRWLADTWEEARALRADGLDVRAVTVWALLGTYDWDRLVVAEAGHYEPGAFDMRGGSPRPTAVAALASELATTGAGGHPVLVGPRWWREPERILYGSERQRPSGQRDRARPLLIVGATGRLGGAFARIAQRRGIDIEALSRADADITDERAVESALERVRPWAVVNAAGYARVDDAESDPQCELWNAVGARVLARATAGRGIGLLTFSTDLVFDGAKGARYLESDAASPISAYGRSKVLAEGYVREVHPGALVVRTSAFFGPWDDANFVTTALRDLAGGRPVRAAEDVIVSPTYVPDLVDETLDLLIDGADGLWHVAGPDALAWADLAERAARIAGISPRTLERCAPDALGWIAPRPRYSALGSERALLLPELEDALGRYVRESGLAAKAVAA